MTAPQKIHSYELAFMFLLGCFIYSLLEIATRGYTHWTMTLLCGDTALLDAWNGTTAHLVFTSIIRCFYDYCTRDGGWCVG